MPELIILDVGHGNCTLIKDNQSAIIVDCPLGNILLDTLEDLSIKEIQHILISHSDADHIGGIIAILLNEDIKIHNIHLNADSSKSTKIWNDLRFALRDAQKRSQVKVSTELNTNKTGELNIGTVEIEILAPNPDLILSGAGGEELGTRRKLTSNSVSVVVGVIHESHRVAILAADIDNIGLSSLLNDYPECSADVLVFPHHGGRPGSGDGEVFAQKLCDVVQPKLIIFSIGRGRFNNPRKEIVKGVIAAVPESHILCTQLSKQCSENLPKSEFTHLNDLPASGRIENSCCGGTVFIELNGSHTNYDANIASHKAFIQSDVHQPLCNS